ncbi:hypothetical protein Hanom_Chr10g00874561 [Helianthus anomalus]
MKTSCWILNQYSIHSDINRVVTIRRSSCKGSQAGISDGCPEDRTGI